MFREIKRNWNCMGLRGLSLLAILAVVIVYGAGLDVHTECEDGYELLLDGPEAPVKIGDTVTFTATLTCEKTKPDPDSPPTLSVTGGNGTSVFDEEKNTITWTGTADVAGLEGLVAKATGGGGVHYWDVIVVKVDSIAFNYEAAEADETVSKSHCTITTIPPDHDSLVTVPDVVSQNITANIIIATCGDSSDDCTFVGFVRDGGWGDTLACTVTTDTASWTAEASNGVEVEACLEVIEVTSWCEPSTGDSISGTADF